MVLLSFSMPGLEEKIRDGTKKRTMRPVREGDNALWTRIEAQFHHYQKDPLVGMVTYFKGQKIDIVAKPIHLQLYWKSRSKQGHKIMDAVLTKITKKKLGKLTEEEWKLDGFSNEEHVISLAGNPKILDCKYADNGLQFFAETYHLPYFENEDGHQCKACNKKKIDGDCDGCEATINPALLNFEVYIIEWQKEDA